MPFDPAWPPHNAELESEPFRNQFNALKELIDTQAATVAAQAVTIASQAAEIAMLQGQVAGLQTALDSVPPGQPTLALQYAGGLDVPMMVTAPRANTVLVQRRYQGETDWPTVATLQYWGPDIYTDTLPGPGVFEYRLIGLNNGGPGAASDVGMVNAV